MSNTAQNDLPEVSMSTFKANPSAFAETGALVMVHNRPRMRVLPVDAPDPARLAAIKTTLRVLGALAAPDDVAQERRALSAERDAERLDDAL